MTILTNEEMMAIDPDGFKEGFARAIEAKILEKLNSQEPVAIAECISYGWWLNRTQYGMKILKDGMPVFANPIPQDDVVKDAARYRWLREYLIGLDTKYDDDIVACDKNSDMDLVIDAAMGEKK